MAEEKRKQSPHYIPELDPARSKSGHLMGSVLIAFEYVSLAVFFLGFAASAIAFFLGANTVMIVAAIIAAVAGIHLISVSAG